MKKQYEKVILKAEQEEHVRKQRKALRKHGVCHDSSKQGSGKSFFLMHHVQTWIRERKADQETPELLLIVPPIALVMWRELTHRHGIRAAVHSYTELRDGKTPYLERTDCTKAGGGKSYAVTEEFTRLVKGGVLIGIDEIHHVCGSSMQAKACVELTRALSTLRLKDPSVFSCVSLLSNTPKGERVGVAGFLKLTGIMKSDKLLRPRVKGRAGWWGFQELYDWCMGVDADETKALINPYMTINSSNVLAQTLKLYQNVLVPEIATNVQATFNNSVVVYTVEKLDRRKFENVATDIMSIERALAIYDKGEKLPPVGGINMNPTFKAFDKEKARSMVARYKHFLETRQCKVALYVRYRETVHFLEREFAEYKPLVLTGEKSCGRKRRNDERELIRQRFQEPSGEYRVLIAHPRVGGESLSFDDQHGDWPRYVCIASSYHTTEDKQIIGRFDRESTRSQARVEILSFDGFQEEDNVFERNREKERISEVIKGSHGSEPLLFEKRTPLSVR